MSDHERGAYTPPTDAPLAFDARQPVRGARPFPVTLVVSVLVLLGLAATIFVFYRSGVRQSAGPPQAVGAPVGGLKAEAPADAQPQDAAAGLEIYRAENGKTPQMVPTPPQFTPPPEQPQARPQGGAPVIVTPPAPGPVTQSAVPPTTVALPPQPVLRPSQSPPPPTAAAPAPKPIAPPAAKAAAPDKVTVEKPKPVPPPARPAAKPAPEKAAEKVAEKPAEKAAGAKAGVAVVQIGAVSSAQLADKTWNDAVAVAPGLAAGKGKGVEKVDKEGKTLYRTSVTGFASKADAAAFCAKLKTAGKACFVK